MIIQPVLMAVRLSPLNDLATTKNTRFCMSVIVISYYKRNYIDLSRLVSALVFTASASLVGVILIHFFDMELHVAAKLSDKSFHCLTGSTGGSYIG